MKKTFLVIVSLLMVFSLVLTGCSQNNEGTEEGAQQESEEKTFKVGINSYGQANFFGRIGKAALEDQIKKNGGEIVATVDDDVPGRIASVENMVSQGCNAIIIQEGDINQLAPALIEAKEKGVLIGSMDSGDADFVDVFVESDNEKLGEDAAKKLVELLDGKGDLVEIYTDSGAQIRARSAAAHKVFDEYPNINIKARFVYAWPDFFPDTKAKMESVLQANPNSGDIDGVFATFDGVGIAAASAIREAGLENDIVIVGIDGDPEAYEEMKKPNSPFKATITQDPDGIARLCVDNIFELLKGNEIPERHIYVPGEPITKDNIPEE